MSAHNSPPLSTNGDAAYNDANTSGSMQSPRTSTTTRTVAVIKHHALDHRFEIERRIQEASFEIVKERQMEFDTETDPEFMYELFGEDVHSLAEGAVWVYVLERRRAIEVWNSLMGNPDPAVARKEAPTSLRALYGRSLAQNGLMGSPDVETAELQIQSLFASSPPFPTTDLPDSRFSTMQSVNSSVLAALKSGEDHEYAQSNVTSGGGSNGRIISNGKPGFKARALPTTHDKPDIVPRMTKAAALRAGVPVVKNGILPVHKPREALSKDRLAETFANVPGHKRAGSIAVASTAAPTIAPRMTRAASLRQGKPAPATTSVRKIFPEEQKDTFVGVPGHKRRETISVASVQAPTVAPRLNKSAALRATKESAPPTSFMFRTASQPKTPGLSRSNSTTSLNGSKPTLSRPASSASIVRPATVSRAASATPLQANNRNGATNGAALNGDNQDPSSPSKPPLRPRPSSIGAPMIVPRTNKSAALRAAKKAEEEAATAAAAARKYGRPKPRPTMTV